MPRKHLLIIALALILLVALIFIVINTQGPRVMVKANPDYKETVYSILGKDDKKISFTVYQTELNAKVLLFRSDSTLPLTDQIKLASILLDRIKKDQPLENFKTLDIGTLASAFGKDDTLSRRLVVAARPLSPVPFAKQNNFVRDIGNQKMIYPELKELFLKHGITIKMAAAEKVLVNKDNIPYDGMVWFSLAK